MEVTYSEIYRLIPKNSQEIHYLAYGLLERSHLQQAMLKEHSPVKWNLL